MSHGTSLQSGLSIGYQFMKNIGIELGFSKAFQNQVVFKRSIKPAWQGYYFDEFIRSYSSYFITPAIVVRSGYEKVNVYSKFGLVVLKGKSNTVYKENNNGFLSEIDYETKGISGLGLHGALGASIRLHKSVDLQLEINTSNVSGSPKSQTITRRIEDGEDLLPEMTVSEKETEYVKEFTITQSDRILLSLQKGLKFIFRITISVSGWGSFINFKGSKPEAIQSSIRFSQNSLSLSTIH
ncbi:MAG: outer membrane beta-barrel protein [Bacteroidota bacterium]|nr:MAG: outer membrane beta-barrel protein [Bacteroidota bacterium]